MTPMTDERLNQIPWDAKQEITRLRAELAVAERQATALRESHADFLSTVAARGFVPVEVADALADELTRIQELLGSEDFDLVGAALATYEAAKGKE